MPQITNENIAGFPEEMKDRGFLGRRFVRQGEIVFWAKPGIGHKDIALLGGLTAPEDGGYLYCDRVLCYGDENTINVAGESDRLRLPRTIEARRKTLDVLRALAEGTPIKVIEGEFKIQSL